MRCVSLALPVFAAACASRAPIEAPIVAPATKPGPAVSLPCDWPVGTTVHYRYEWRRLDSRTPGSEKVTSVSPAALTVTGKDRLSLDIGLTELTGPARLVDAARAMSPGFDLSAMELVVQKGKPVKLANGEALVNETLFTGYAMLPPETPPVASASVEVMVGNPATAVELLHTEPSTLLGAICTVMGDGERIESSVESAGPMGGPNVRNFVTLDAKIRPEEGTATYTLITITDPESLNVMKEHHLKLKSLPPEVGETMPPLQLVDTRSVLIAVHALSDGLPISVEATQITVVGDNEARREDRWTWTRVTPP